MESEKDRREFYSKVFDNVDSNGDGKLTIKELKKYLEEKCNEKLSDREVANIFVDIDKNGDGFITKTEFMTEMMKLSAKEAKEEYQKSFKKWDKNGNGKLSREELKAAISELGQFTDAEIDCMIEREDKNKDGEIDYNEFMKAMCPDYHYTIHIHHIYCIDYLCFHIEFTTNIHLYYLDCRL